MEPSEWSALSEVKANRSVTLHMVSSLDGFIAKKDNTVSWLDGYADVYEKGVSEDGGERPSAP